MFKSPILSLLPMGILVVATACSKDNAAKPFLNAIANIEVVALYEGLPHPMYERDQLQEERNSNDTLEMHDNLFYLKPLEIEPADASRLREVICSPGSLTEGFGTKKCGGFHADFSVEWKQGEERFLALLCFGCRDVSLFGPGYESHYELGKTAANDLNEILRRYRKNRPKTEQYQHALGSK